MESHSQSTLPSESSMATTSKKRAFRSHVWDHFTWDGTSDPNKPKSSCNYCGQQYVGNSKTAGTANMGRHLKKCTKYLAETDKQQRTLPYVHVPEEKASTSTYLPETSRQALARMIIKEELPMRMVELGGFKEFVDTFQRDFIIPSRRKVTRDIELIYKKREKTIGGLHQKSSQRICLTTDSWSSLQNVNYIVVTGHFVDGSWKLHKKILNFCKIEDHKRETFANKLEKCLQEWGTEKVFTITVDSASSNNVAITQLVRILRHGKGLVLDGRYVHVHCFTHILNLIVTEELKEHDASIDRVRNAVKYVKGSLQRLQSFKNCLESVKIKFKGNVILDVPTRWNSMYLMLDNAEKCSKVFELLLDTIRSFKVDMGVQGPPTANDWAEVRELCKLLKVFYDTTVKVSASLQITAHRYVVEACEVKQNIQEMTNSESLVSINMTLGMMIKLNKYWGSFEKFNPLFFVAILLDPTCKGKVLEYCLVIFFGSDKVFDLYVQVEDLVEKLYMEYREVDDSPDCTIVGIEEPGKDLLSKFWSSSSNTTLEYKDYLHDKVIPHSKNFDALAWWKKQEHYPVLRQIARDVLTIPISTVASKSAFSCGGRIIGESRTSLLPTTVETIICTQSWIRSTTPILAEATEGVEDYETIIEELVAHIRRNDLDAEQEDVEEVDETILD